MDEAEEILYVVFVPHDQAPEALQPGEEPLDLPASAVTPKRPAILGGDSLTVVLMRGNHLDALLGQPLIEWVLHMGVAETPVCN